MKASELISQLVDAIDALGDPMIVVPAYAENTYEAIRRLEMTTMVERVHANETQKFGRLRTVNPLIPAIAAIVLRG